MIIVQETTDSGLVREIEVFRANSIDPKRPIVVSMTNPCNMFGKIEYCAQPMSLDEARKLARELLYQVGAEGSSSTWTEEDSFLDNETA